MLDVNAKSAEREIIEELLTYLYSEECQMDALAYSCIIVRRDLLVDSVVNYEGVYTTKEQVDEVVQLLENAQCDPVDAEYVWTIISEEAAFILVAKRV